MDYSAVQRQILLECAEDHVGLWSVISEIQVAAKKNIDPATVQRRTLNALRPLLEAGLVQAGHPAPGGREFVAWPIPASEAIERIKRQWDTLGREPNIGDIVWFTTTDKGDHVVREMK